MRERNLGKGRVLARPGWAGEAAAFFNILLVHGGKQRFQLHGQPEVAGNSDPA